MGDFVSFSEKHWEKYMERVSFFNSQNFVLHSLYKFSLQRFGILNEDTWSVYVGLYLNLKSKKQLEGKGHLVTENLPTENI